MIIENEPFHLNITIQLILFSFHIISVLYTQQNKHIVILILYFAHDDYLGRDLVCNCNCCYNSKQNVLQNNELPLSCVYHSCIPNDHFINPRFIWYHALFTALLLKRQILLFIIIVLFEKKKNVHWSKSVFYLYWI